MLNVDVARNNTNDQYQTLKDSVNKLYTTHGECSIEFEVDGPSKVSILMLLLFPFFLHEVTHFLLHKY